MKAKENDPRQSASATSRVIPRIQKMLLICVH